MRIRGYRVAAALLTTIVWTNPALASPPSGMFTFEELARGQVVENGTVNLPAATDLVSASYAAPPGATSGWRRGPGETVVAVTSGVITVVQADGCHEIQYKSGEAVILPAGQFVLRNGGDGPAGFAGVFFNLPPGGPAPLVDGAADQAPADCANGGGAGPGLSISNMVRGTVSAQAQYHEASVHAAGDSIAVEAGGDALVTLFHLEPGFSTGWFKHTEQVVVVSRGTLTFYEGHDGKCVKADEYRAGQAYHHAPHDHMAVNEGDETVDLTAVNFNLPHGSAHPVVGSQGEANDFTPAPPADCPRLR
jgi:quercetin dioxygenase-like cupin family protein